VYLDAARAHLRHVAYLYCRAKLGPTMANRLFGKVPIGERLLGLMLA
jgi:hypothetical protein